MNKKRLSALLLFGCLVIAFMFFGATLMIKYTDELDFSQMIKTDAGEQEPTRKDKNKDANSIAYANELPPIHINQDIVKNSFGTLPKKSHSLVDKIPEKGLEESMEEDNESLTSEAFNINGGKFLVAPIRELITDHTKVDYEAYIPEMIYNQTLENALDIQNPSLAIKAEAAILFDAKTGEVLYCKNAVDAIYPASTIKLLTALTVLDWSDLDEEVTIGPEVKMIASDSTKANIYVGQILTIQNLLEGMLLPSGNDAAYVLATYIGRISLKDRDSEASDAVTEFVRLMNEKAIRLGAINSNFKTPDGYDALGQYTTAYDMGLIGLEAMKNSIIMKITNKSSSRNRFVSGQDVTWRNTNSLISKSSGKYYEYCLGLKTGTSTMAGKCLISAGNKNGREVLSVVMNSTSAGRWSDTITLLDYGLKR